jgi:serine/threonine-protein kinase RsbW
MKINIGRLSLTVPIEEPTAGEPMDDASKQGCEFDPDQLLVKLDFRLPGDVESIQPAVDEIMGVVGAQECATGAEFEVEVALLEALANAVKHGCEDDPTKIIEVCVACEMDRGMLIIVRDPGTGFDPGEIPSPVTGENVFYDHGRGIFLINELMDVVEYKNGGTEIWMRKK